MKFKANSVKRNKVGNVTRINVFVLISIWGQKYIYTALYILKQLGACTHTDTHSVFLFLMCLVILFPFLKSEGILGVEGQGFSGHVSFST